ncbi:uncharacterized protein LOC114950055 isoform X2 [Acropora millepora]|uniref:uncharacterized protein LOC114950055 isoform X2 n=1 Tax=Acropora millepora TaxID=45264 RepID=UPI001CF514D3|nr:uncharacterized protein LOC114950055 isoform X2 [Acropora millepora]
MGLSRVQILVSSWLILCSFKEPIEAKNITVKLGFIGALDKSLGATSSLGRELSSAFKLAVEIINAEAANNGSKIKFSTDFKSMIKDGGANPSITCKIAAQQLAADSDVVGVVGAMRSSCSKASHQYFRDNAPDMTQISYASTEVELSNKKKYPRFFRTCAVDSYQATALAEMVDHFNWRRVSTIATSDDYAKNLADSFEREARLQGIRIYASSRLSGAVNPAVLDSKLQMIKDAQTRVNLVFALPSDAQAIFEAAKAKGMTGQGWVWIGSDGVLATPPSNATKAARAMQGSMGILPKGGMGRKSLNIIVTWLYKKSIQDQYPGIIYTHLPLTSSYVPQVYDAVYSYYLAFDKMAREGTITKYDSPATLRRLVFDELKKFNYKKNGFVGAQGPHTYFGSPWYEFGNLQGTDVKKVLKWSKSVGLERTKIDIVWPGNTKTPPTDKGLPGKTTFRIGFIAPIHPDLAGLSELGREFESAFRVAVEMMNRDLSLSVDFDIRIQDGGVDSNASCKAAAEELTKDGVVAVIGAYRSSCSVAAANVLGSAVNRIPQISYASTSAVLSDKTKFKYFFRTCPSDVHQASALAAVFRKYLLPEVGTVATNDIYGKELADMFEKEVTGMADVPVNVVSKQRFDVNARAGAVRPKIWKLKESGSKVHLLSMVRHDAETVFQQIKELGMTGKGWVWIGTDGATSSTFSQQKDLQRAMKGMIGTQPKNGEGSVYLKFLASWLRKDSTTYPGIVHNKKSNPSSAAFTAQLFDAVHGVAWALSDLVNKKVISRTSDVQTVRDNLYQKLRTYNAPSSGFPSATGTSSRMYFNQNQDPPAIYDIVNLVDSNWITVGQYDYKTKEITLRRDPVFSGGVTLIPEKGRPTYKIAAFFPTHEDLGPLNSLGLEWQAAFKVAVELVNSGPFKVAFTYVLPDGSYDADTCRQEAENLPSDTDLIIGEARSECSIAIAEATKNKNIPQMSYASTSAELSDKQTYPNFFRTCASDVFQSQALAKLVQRYKWSRVSTITTSDSHNDDLALKFAKEVRRAGVDITTEQRFEAHTKASIKENLKEIKESGSAVNLVSAATDDSEKVFQEAIEQGMTGKGWAWIGTDGATTSPFTESPNLQRAMQGMIGTRPKNGEGPLYQRLLKIWKEKDAISYPGLVHSPRSQEASAYVAQVYDSVLAFAHALTSLHEAGTINKYSSRAEVQNEVIAQLRKMKDANTGFESSTGDKMFFDSHQDAPAVYDVVNLNGDTWINVGSYDPSPDQGLRLKKKIVWPGGSLLAPSDSFKASVKELASTEVPQANNASQEGIVALGVVFGVFAISMGTFIAYLIYREKRGRPSFAPQVFRRKHSSPVTEISAVLNNGNVPVIRNPKEPLDV